MALSLTHTFQSAKADDVDDTIVRPSNWNAEHTITAGANTILGAVTAGAVGEISCTAAGRALLDDADAAAQRTTLGLTALSTTSPGTNVATFLATPSSANLAAALTDETGSGAAVFANSPTLTSPAIGGTGALINTHMRVWTNDISNTFIGYGVGANIQTPPTTHSGDGNTLIGSNVAPVATTMFAATIVGGESGSALTTGDSNTIFGYQNGNALTTGKWNTLIGVDCILTDTDCANNVVIGHHTGTNIAFSADQGECVVIGAEALKVGVGGISSVIVGYRAGYNSNASAESNVLVGHLSGFTNTAGTKLTATGKDSLFSNTDGVENGAFGYRALYNTTTGDSNTAFGAYAGYTNATGNSNVFFGSNAGYYETGSNKLFIDNAARSNEADGRAKSLIYGVFGTGPSDQTLQINGKLIAYGTTTNDSAAAGQIGEYSEAELTFASRVTLTSATGTDIVSISLAPGDYSVSGAIKFQKDATTVVSYHVASLSTTSATLGSDKQQSECDNYPTGAGTNTLTIPHQQIKLASTTTLYLVAQSGHTTSFVKAWGYLCVRRMR